MGARNRGGIGCRTCPPGCISGGIDSLESIPGLLKSFKIPTQLTDVGMGGECDG